MKKNEYTKWYLVIAVFAIIFTFFGGSLAYWQWTTNTSERTSIALTVTEDFRCDADGGGDITSGEKYLVPTDCTNGQYAIKRMITVEPQIFTEELNINYELQLKINSIDSALKNSNNFKYALTTDENSCTNGVIESGTFYGLNTGRTVDIFSNTYSSTKTENYYLYIWLDKEETNTATMDKNFSLSLTGSCSNAPEIEPEKPVLDSGMIPVTISNTGMVTTISEDSEDWYNYANKEWANVVLVNENATNGVTGSKSREYYKNNPGTIVVENDILAYYVWIPRYKYRIWTTGVSRTGNENKIGIIFEKYNDEISLGTTVDSYRTHPAFIWNGEAIGGIWVGKFETSTNKSSSCYVSDLEENCNNTNHEPRILPNVRSLRAQNISNQFQTSLKFAGGTLTNGNVSFVGSDTYGLTTSSDSHMMKNSEWGAVAYLSSSKYGTNKEIYMNNSTDYYTGRSGGDVSGQTDELVVYSWIGQVVNSDGSFGAVIDTTLGTKASTTGNVTGVYDISGGALEHVMGVLSDIDGNLIGKDSGFAGTITEGILFPESKYYDLYLQSQFNGTTSTNVNFCTVETCGGHALNETAGWYNDFIGFVSPNGPWFKRGGYPGSSNGYAGTFYTQYSAGEVNSSVSWRSVVIVGDGIS